MRLESSQRRKEERLLENNKEINKRKEKSLLKNKNLWEQSSETNLLIESRKHC